MLPKLDENFNLKDKFQTKFQEILTSNIDFREFLYEIFVEGTAYVVGGFLRDILLNKQSRDLDMIVSLPFKKTAEILNSSKLNYQTNRLNGFKIILLDFEVDLWCLENNWAFKENLVVQNDDNILESISNGCFYNYDSLVINIHTNNLNIRHFKEFLETKKLDIIQKNKKYKELSPTIEGNILRAFYLRKLYNIDYTSNCNEYLLSRIGYLNDLFPSAIERLIKSKIKYPKYDETLDENYIYECVNYCKNNSHQKSLEF